MPKTIDFMPPLHPVRWLRARAPAHPAFPDVALSFKGRDAIACAARHFDLSERSGVLLPGYLCDTISAAFGRRARIGYYDVAPDFTLDARAIGERLARGDVRVLYVIHYFGFLQRNTAELARLCREHGALLFEDHAHSAFSRFDPGLADARIFSFRKLLAIPEGGGLWLRDSRARPPDGARWRSDLGALAILAKRLAWAHSRRLREAAHRLAARDLEALGAGDAEVVPRPISRWSARSVAAADGEAIFAERRALFGAWQRLLAGTPLRPVFPELPDDVAPQGFPIWVANPDELIGRAEREGVFLTVHWPLPPPLEGECPVAWAMSRSIVTLPIYPGLAAADLNRVADLVLRHARALDAPPVAAAPRGATLRALR